METISIVAVLILVCSVHYGATAQQEDCKVPADVVFILDESNSISYQDFIKQLEFVNKVIDHFTVDEENMHVGVMSFGRDVNTDILALGERRFLNDPEAMKNRILAYNDERPRNNDRTRTDLALQHARTDMFRNARRDIPHIAIIITDGEPNSPTGTDAEARRITKQKADQLKATGVTLFAIGVGRNSKQDQLLEMATDNSNEYVFWVDSYNVLEEIEEQLTMRVCPPKQFMQECDESFRPLDVMFAAANEAGVADTAYTIDFFKRLTKKMAIGPEQVKVSLTRRNCLDLDGFAFDNFLQDEALGDALDDRRLQKTYLGSQLDDIFRGFSTRFGARQMERGSKLVRVALVVVDNQIADPNDVANKVRELEADKIRLYVVGVGKHVDEGDLKLIASTQRHYFYASSYNQLYALIERITDELCKEISREDLRQGSYHRIYNTEI